MAVCLKKAIKSYGATNDRGDVARPLMSLAAASSLELQERKLANVSVWDVLSARPRGEYTW